MGKSQLWQSKLLLLVSSLVVLQCLIRAAIDEHSNEWRAHQTAYATALAEKARRSNKPSPEFPIEVRQAYLSHLDLKRVDRCTTCHVGIDNPGFADAEQPLTAHSGGLLQHHPPDKFGCTICHEGQGRATEKDAAHGHVPHWNKPLLVGDFIQASCSKCHQDDPIPQAPVLARGRRLMRDLGCVDCHKAGGIVAENKVGPRLDAIGSKVSRKWLNKWLTDSKDYLPHGKMPHYGLTPYAANALAAYLMTFRDTSIDELRRQEGDYDEGATVYREAQCIVCHVTKLDYADNPVGGTIGPDLRKLGNKVNQRWLMAFFKNPHAFLPNTKMPRYHFRDREVLNLSQFAIEEWVDFDLLDAEEAQPQPPADEPELIQQGQRLYVELDCGNCHELRGVKTKGSGPDLTFIGSRPVHQFDFGKARVRRSLPDFFYTKLRSPKTLHSMFRLAEEQNPLQTIWRNLKPASLFSDSAKLPDGTGHQRLDWILQRTQEVGLLDGKRSLPNGTAEIQTKWLVGVLNEVDGLSALKMPDFQLSKADAAAITIALMSLTKETVSSKQYEVPSRTKVIFNPKDAFGTLERRYRCLSCHTIRDSGDLLASDLTYQGSRVNREWLYHYMNKPYSMRRTITIAMPIFHFPDKDSRFMADYMSQVFVDTRIGANWKQHKDKARAQRGKQLFDEKGCIACHQRHETGGDVGPSLTTQVPEFPHGTWVGDKLQGAWIYEWLKNPQALLPDTLEPNLGLSDQETLDLTAYLLTLKNPEFQGKK